MADTFYGSSRTPQLSPEPTVSPRNVPSSRESVREPASSRRFFGVQSPASPSDDGEAAVSDTAFREGAATLMSRLGLSSPGPDDMEDSVTIRQAERELQETFRKTGGSDVMGVPLATSSHGELSDQCPAMSSAASNGRLSSNHHSAFNPQTYSVNQTFKDSGDGLHSEQVHPFSGNVQPSFSQRQVHETSANFTSSSFNSDRSTDPVGHHASKTSNAAVHERSLRIPASAAER